jgi:orotidine-5'-phosphate decarboxylase
VERLALLTKNCGLDGVVCSSQEVRRLRNLMGDDFLLVTPGIRPANTEVGDQKRVMTPSEAIREGSDYLVVGRPITQSPEPLQALEAIMQEVSVDST